MALGVALLSRGELAPLVTPIGTFLGVLRAAEEDTLLRPAPPPRYSVISIRSRIFPPLFRV